MGLNYTLNHCLSKATGEFIARMDGDDRCVADRFERELSVFREEPFILLKSGNKMRQIATGIFAEHRISPNVCFEFDQLMTSISFAESGFGTCFLTDTILRYVGPCKNVVYYQPDTEFSDRTLYIMHKKNKYLPFACREFIDFLQKD